MQVVEPFIVKNFLSRLICKRSNISELVTHLSYSYEYICMYVCHYCEYDDYPKFVPHPITDMRLVAVCKWENGEPTRTQEIQQ